MLEQRQQHTDVGTGRDKIAIRDLDFWYGDFNALKNVTVPVKEHAVTAFIGPSGCGKSTVLRCLNRMNDLIPGTRVEGLVSLDGDDIYAPGVDPVDIRRRVGMIFQQPNPFPMSIYDNVAYGPRLQGMKRKAQLDEIVEKSLQRANLWKETKDILGRTDWRSRAASSSDCASLACCPSSPRSS